MNDISTNELTHYLIDAKHALATLSSKAGGTPQIQGALRILMEDRPLILENFLQLADEQPETARKVLSSAVSALVNLLAVDNASAELRRRAEGN